MFGIKERRRSRCFLVNALGLGCINTGIHRHSTFVLNGRPGMKVCRIKFVIQENVQ